MHLSTEVLAHFKGGELEIQNEDEGYVYRGEIKDIEVVDRSVKVKFVWLAKGTDGFPPLGWVRDEKLDYAASTDLYFASPYDDGRILMHSPIVHELAVFFPPDGSRLDPAKVEGLKLIA